MRDPERLVASLREVLDLVQQLPSGIDVEADPWQTSGIEDMNAHIGGLIFQTVSSALSEWEGEANA